MTDIFIAIHHLDFGTYYVYPANSYQKEGYEYFMNNNKNNVNLKVGLGGCFEFTMEKFHDTHLNGDYSSFCILINDKNERHILSNNKELLNYYVNYRNRIMT